MKRKSLAMAVAGIGIGAAVPPALAQSSVALYGIVDSGITCSRNQKGRSAWPATSGNEQGARLGARRARGSRRRHERAVQPADGRRRALQPFRGQCADRVTRAALVALGETYTQVLASHAAAHDAHYLQTSAGPGISCRSVPMSI
ncbi:gram-negative porin family protein [Burkholderia pseudomallei]|nr:gram-negative porin family protein [Burkholderia pseudomallei]CAJ3233696.1 gram-negative porin family protein [Burkholderia pseudomallei]CAJ3251853.1 gram-negative porin family protein [Burkholderia pseudomallei]CAJ3301614.1 gram-negative porin family protein [Burkholderia pseudomallei]CAJ3790191.1 gram-negative porin family protein [Burkholderia pseudomallei]